MRLATALAACGLVAVGAAAAVPAEVRSSDYGGWDATSLSNGLVEVVVVPQVGGRIMQYRLADKEFFWVNPDLRGKVSPPGGLGDNGSWLNYGGEKLWPAPQGQAPDGWPGPPDGVLDGSPHSLSTVAKAGEAAVRVTSQDDPRSGIRFSRAIRLRPGSTKVMIHATVTNIDTKPRAWGIWSVAQNDCVAPGGEGFNKRVKVYCPLNADSRYPKGYRLMYGVPDNPTWVVNPAERMFRLDYQNQVGKVGLDSAAGWLATVDGERGYAFVERFAPKLHLPHPDGANVEFWSSGGGLPEVGANWELSYDPKMNPYLLETELLGPLHRMKPGQSGKFDYSFAACKLGGDYPVVDCADYSLTSQRLTAVVDSQKVHLSGRFGVFQPGHLVAQLVDRRGKPLGIQPASLNVTPLEPVVLDAVLTQGASPARRAVVWLYDAAGTRLEKLAECAVTSPRDR